MAHQLPGSGPHRFWGFSPSYDVREASAEPPADDSMPHATLLLCPGDARHILHTLARARAREGAPSERELEFAVYEDTPEALARHLLLVAIALDFELPRRERAEVWLEVFANVVLRERTAAYVAARAQELKRALARGEGPLAPLFDLSGLKMKQKDALEEAVGTWLEGVPFDVVKLRDERLRAFYKDRYDHRRNVLDWDYSMGLVETAPIIHRVHFREWRMSGLAFELRDAAYDSPNRSLASSAAGKQRGASVLKRGFWGDVVNSPYAALGVECDDSRFFQRRSEQQLKTACDVAYYNVVGWFHRLETGKPFGVKQEDFDDFAYGSSVGAGWQKGFLRSDQPGPRPLQQVQEGGAEEEEEEEEGGGGALSAEAAAAAAAAEAEQRAAKQRELARRRLQALPKFRLLLLTGSPLDTLGKARLGGRFAHAHVGSHAAHLLAAFLCKVLAPRATLSVESARFLVEVHKEAKRAYCHKVLELGERAGLAPAPGSEALDGVHASWVRFEFDRAREQERREAAAAKYGAAEAPADAAAADDGGAALGGALSAPAADAPETGAPAADLETPEVVGARAADEGKAAKPKPADVIGPAAKVCAITGLPAKYRDPQTGLYYANLDAFKEIRRRAAESAPAAADGAAAKTAASDESRTPVAGSESAPPDAATADSADAADGADDSDEVIRPRGQPSLVKSSGGVVRRLNKVV